MLPFAPSLSNLEITYIPARDLPSYLFLVVSAHDLETLGWRTAWAWRAADVEIRLM